MSKFIPAGSGGGLLVYLAKKLPLDEKEFTDGKDALADQLARGKSEAIFHEWFKQRRAAANIMLARAAKDAKS